MTLFELYSFWTWIPVFLGASVAAQGIAQTPHIDAMVSLLALGTIAVGGLGCVWGGLAADRRA
ncbi:MAG: hypothetical protein ABI442_00985 [Gemmatimonadaceae bacterium]